MNKEIFIAVGALIGATVSLLQVVMKFIGERRRDAVATRRLVTAKEQIEVLAKWYKVKTKIADEDAHEQIRAAVNAKLDEVMMAAEKSQTRDPETQASSTLYRSLLLFYPRSAIGWLSRIALIFCVSFAVLVAVVPVEGQEPSGTQGELFLGLAICFGFPSILLYALSIWDGGRRRSGAGHSSNHSLKSHG